MRTREYLSPSQVKKWRASKCDYYLEYLADYRPPKTPQTLPMAMGSAFDVLIKKSLSRRFKAPHSYPVDVDQEFERQVENDAIREQAREAGEHLLNCYKVSGAYQDLVMEIGDPKFLRMESKMTKPLFGIPFMLLPDIDFKRPSGLQALYDWKVNGYCSASNTSPYKGFVKVRDGWRDGHPHSRGHNTAHKQAVLRNIDGVLVNIDRSCVNPEWDLQLTCYGLGLDMVAPFIVGIEQLACKHLGGTPYPRVASHRWVVSDNDITALRIEVSMMWEHINSDWVFREMTKAESQRLQKDLEGQAKTLYQYKDLADMMR